jgi:hypothetical protein
MASIYSNASQVVLWLGEESDESTSAFENMRALGEGVEVWQMGGVKGSTTKSDSLAEVLENDPMAMAQMAPVWLAIGKLLRRACECILHSISPSS